MTKKKKKRISKKQKTTARHIGKGIFIGYTLILSLFLIISFAGIELDMKKTSNGDFNIDIMALSIKNPYKISQDVVIFSDDYGNPYIKDDRTTWVGTDLTFWDAFGVTSSPPYLENLDVGIINSETGWSNAPHTDYDKWASGQDWESLSIKVDPDAKNSGLPNLAITYSNLYASDSNGDLDETYGHTNITRTLIDDEGNTRILDIHTGFITLEFQFTVEADYDLEFPGANNIVSYLMGEVVGKCRSNYVLQPTLGAGLDFDSVFRIQISELRFEDDWALNPDWMNAGNGILGIQKRGFSTVIFDGDEFNGIASDDTSNWRYDGNYQSVENTQDEILQKYDSTEDALDKAGKLTDDNEVKYVDFRKQNPREVFFSIDEYIELGCDWEQALLIGAMLEDSIEIQKVVWGQKVTVQFYTSQTMPIAGSGYDPIKIYIENEEPSLTDKDRIWDRIANWLADLLGVKKQMAEVIMIACIIGITILVILILLAIFAPQVLGFLGKAIAGAFKRSAERRAARRATRK